MGVGAGRHRWQLAFWELGERRELASPIVWGPDLQTPAFLCVKHRYNGWISLEKKHLGQGIAKAELGLWFDGRGESLSL